MSLLTAACMLSAQSTSRSYAQEDTQAAPEPTVAHPERPKHPQKARVRKPARINSSSKLKTITSEPPAAAPQAAQATPQAAPGPNAPTVAPQPAPTPPSAPAPQPPRKFTAQLEAAGARTCAPRIEQFVAATMDGVTGFNTASHWATAGGDAHAVSVFVGQQYGGNLGVPYGLTGVFAVPAGAGTCDAMSVQVVPSPLPCAKLRDTLSAHGKVLGDLAGVPLLENAGDQYMLVPTGANACVLVGLRIAYGK